MVQASSGDSTGLMVRKGRMAKGGCCWWQGLLNTYAKARSQQMRECVTCGTTSLTGWDRILPYLARILFERLGAFGCRFRSPWNLIFIRPFGVQGNKDHLQWLIYASPGLSEIIGYWIGMLVAQRYIYPYLSKYFEDAALKINFSLWIVATKNNLTTL